MLCYKVPFVCPDDAAGPLGAEASGSVLLSLIGVSAMEEPSKAWLALASSIVDNEDFNAANAVVGLLPSAGFTAFEDSFRFIRDAL